MSNIFAQLNTVENDEEQLRRIKQLEDAFASVRESYQHEHDDNLRKALNTVKSKIKKNKNMRHAVNKFVDKYVKDDIKEQGREDLYDLLSAEMLQTINTLQHAEYTDCTIL